MSKITQGKNIRGKTQTAKNITINFKAVRISYVKFLCSIKGIKSIYELAKMLKVSYQHLYYVLTGKRQSKKLIREISQILGVDLEKEFQKLERRLKP
jgi:transcriptional regulator with XRE-family HTH domain